MNPVMTYGVNEQNPLPAEEFDAAIEELDIRGYSVLPSGLSSDELELYRRALDSVYNQQAAEIGGAEVLEQITDANVIRCPLAYDDRFTRLATNPVLFAVARRLLGGSFVLIMQNGVSNPPGQTHYQTRWHRDLNYQHWVSSRPLAMSALFCLDPFEPETGCTWTLPGTHLLEPFPSEPYARKHEVPVRAPAGAIILMNAMLFHRAGENRSTFPRRAVNHVIGRPFLGQQLDMPKLLNGRYADDPLLSAYLGYRWNPKASVTEWRKEKFQNT